jgi:hypothetical protein
MSPRSLSPFLSMPLLGNGLDLNKHSLQTEQPQNWHHRMCFSFWKVTTLQEAQSEVLVLFLFGAASSNKAAFPASFIL